MFSSLGVPELLIIAAVILLLFGAKKMPTMARSLGQSMRILKSETKGMRADEAQDGKADPAAATPATPAEPQQLPQAQAQKPVVAPPIEQTQANKNAG